MMGKNFLMQIIQEANDKKRAKNLFWQKNFDILNIF